LFYFKIIGYIYSYKQPHRIAKFLSALRHRLEKSNQVDEFTEFALQETQRRKKKMTTDDGIGRFNKLIPRIMENLSTLYILGLTEYHFSSAALHELQLLLEVTKGTLTSLDLSFAYIGIHGAEILAKILADPTNQLMNLHLKGNLLGDPGVSLLAHGLKVSAIITSLFLNTLLISLLL
jgi:hypothetical protein